MDRTGDTIPPKAPVAMSSHPSKELASCEVFSAFVTKFTLIDTAEDSSQWGLRARRQWGGANKHIAIRISSQSIQRGCTPPMKLTYGPDGAGASWDSDVGIEVPLQTDPMLVLEVICTKHTEATIGLGVLNAEAMISGGRQFGKFNVHLLPTQTAIDANTVHAVAEVEIHSSLLDERPEKSLTPLEYNYGSVRISTVDFYYPPFFLTESGQYIISNVLCAMNMTDSSSLAMQLVPVKEAAAYVSAAPCHVITVRPQQRVYFTATWTLSQKAYMKPLQMQLLVNGSQQPSAPVIIRIHNSVPLPTNTDLPYQYWANTVCITNRQMLQAQELPLIKEVLPIYCYLGSYSGNSPQNGDAEKRSPNDAGGTIQLCENSNSEYVLENASFIIRDTSGSSGVLSSRGPLLNLSQKTCLCTVTLGIIRGFPIVFEQSTGVSPSFQVSTTLLDQQGWQIIKGETLPSYQSASGSLNWTEQLVLRKWPGALCTQFLRLNLTEVRAKDGDETPIGAGLISLSTMDRLYAKTTISIAFYVYETYSLYDELNSSSLLMKNVDITFSDVR